LPRNWKKNSKTLRKQKLRAAKELMNQEFDLSKKTRVARLEERAATEAKKLDEIQDALSKLIKSLKIGSVLSEDEYFKLLEV